MSSGDPSEVLEVDLQRPAFAPPSPLLCSLRRPIALFLAPGRPKAVVAAEALAAIRPGIDATARVLSIPMPDHPLGGGDEGVRSTMATVDELRVRGEAPWARGRACALLTHTPAPLQGLIASHDVVFLMTDTRESRWL